MRPALLSSVVPTARPDVPIGDRQTGNTRVKHSSTRALYTYWNELRGARAAPDRGEIEPGAIRGALGDSFILSFEPSGHCFRLAGTRLCAVFGRELKGETFDLLWSEADRSAARDFLDITGNEIAGIVAGVTGATAEGVTVDLELLLLPLRHRGSSRARQIGVLAPLIVPFWLGATPITSLSLKSHRHIGPTREAVPTLVAAADTGRVRHGLLVYDGGRV